jgi:prephenate dehydrogenase
MRLAVIGVGLIGGSIGLAARRRVGARVVGWDPDEAAMRAALAAGAIDQAARSVGEAVAGADVVFVAAPVGALPSLIDQALRASDPSCVVSDVGSTKRTVVQAIDDPRFVGGHPLAGAETAGVANAREDLFDGACWYLTPTASNPPETLARVRDLIASLGAQPVSIAADAHDELMARVSHLPHVLANVLVATAAAALERADGAGRSLALEGGPSFRDATRVAGANTAIWRDIYLTNADALIEAIDEVIASLLDVRQALAGGDGEKLSAWNERARAARERLG